MPANLDEQGSRNRGLDAHRPLEHPEDDRAKVGGAVQVDLCLGGQAVTQLKPACQSNGHHRTHRHQPKPADLSQHHDHHLAKVGPARRGVHHL